MAFFLYTLIKYHFPCSTDSPKANFPFVSSTSSIRLFHTLHRGEEVPSMQKITQNGSTTTENCGWRQLEEQKQQVTSTNCALFGSRNKGGCAKMKTSTFWKRQFWFCHTADKIYETISQVLQAALPAGKSLYTTLSKRREEWKDTETTDKHISS